MYRLANDLCDKNISADFHFAPLSLSISFQCTQRASSAPYNAAKRPSRTNAIKPPANASASAPGLFRKAALAAATDSAGASKSGGGAVEMLKSFLARRYQPEAHLLNLDVSCVLLLFFSLLHSVLMCYSCFPVLQNMADDEIFKGPHALTAPGFKSQTRSSAALAMWKLVREKYPDVRHNFFFSQTAYTYQLTSSRSGHFPVACPQQALGRVRPRPCRSHSRPS